MTKNKLYNLIIYSIATFFSLILFYLIFKVLKVIVISKNYIQLGCFLYLILIFTPLIPGGSFFNDFNSTIFWINFSLLYASNKNTNIFNQETKLE